MGMTLSDLERRMSGGELVAHIAEMRLTVDERQAAYDKANS